MSHIIWLKLSLLFLLLNSIKTRWRIQNRFEFKLKRMIMVISLFTWMAHSMVSTIYRDTLFYSQQAEHKWNLHVMFQVCKITIFLEGVGLMSNDSVTYGCVMALLGSFFAGSSMVLQKVGVRKSRRFWWLGILCLILGEVLTVVAYTNAPAVLVSPLGAMRVIVTTLLSVKYLREQIQDSTKELFSKQHTYIR